MWTVAEKSCGPNVPTQIKCTLPMPEKAASPPPFPPLPSLVMAPRRAAAAARARADSESESSKPRKDAAAVDARWLEALSEPELDVLISLKELAFTRASNAGFSTDLADRIFHLRALRALAIVLLQESKERLGRASATTELFERLALLNDPTEGEGEGEDEVAMPLPVASVHKKRKQMQDGFDDGDGAQSPKRPRAREE
ncbi:hypothetical protein BS78_10G266100 [Paspalum vaginatum]|nr:hypothetical protein BS78_10G266100 [Paspalum vaginatum]